MKKYDEFWNFKGYSMKEGSHGIHNYPAMLMPKIVQTIMNDFENKNITFFDPFVGSGTTLVEAQKQGFARAIGTDLNPLGLLISKVKTENYNSKLVEYYIQNFEYNIHSIQTEIIPQNFPIINNWFKSYVIKDLGKISYFISKINDEKISNFFKVAFSETVRYCSFTRNNEFKMYRMKKEDRETFNPNVFAKMIEILKRNFVLLFNKENELNKTLIFLNEIDSRKIGSKTFGLEKGVDLIITSPPYGDSHTTVAYGQFSRLSNEWLGITESNKIDSKLLGGIKKTIDGNYKFNISILDETIEKIKVIDQKFKSKRYLDVIAFYKDYEETIDNIIKVLNKDAEVVYIVGNRRVRNIELPTDEITKIMFERKGLKYQKTIIRDILNKRMPLKATNENNKIGLVDTMSKEYIVFLKKVNS